MSDKLQFVAPQLQFVGGCDYNWDFVWPIKRLRLGPEIVPVLITPVCRTTQTLALTDSNHGG